MRAFAVVGWLAGVATLVVGKAAEDVRGEPEYFDYEVTISEQPRGLGVQLDDTLVITAFAPGSVLQETGEPQVGDKLLSIAGEDIQSTSRIRELLKESEYPLVLEMRATVTEDRTCVAPPKGGRLLADIEGDELDPESFDYLAADFTTGDQLFSEPVEVVLADPPQACYDNIKNSEEVFGKVVMVTRGRCSFVQKITYLNSLGVKGVVIANDGSGLLHIPKPPLGARKGVPKIPAVMITSHAGRALRKMVANQDGDAQAPVTVSFRPDAEVARMWKEISPLLVSSSAWPEEVKDRTKRYRKLSQVHHPDKPKGSKDRFSAIAEAYKRANFDLNPEVQAEYKGIDDYMENA